MSPTFPEDRFRTLARLVRLRRVLLALGGFPALLRWTERQIEALAEEAGEAAPSLSVDGKTYMRIKNRREAA